MPGQRDRSGLPGGTVTFLFTDIEGSTRLFRELDDAYPTLLAEHHALLRTTFDMHNGVEVETEGDAFFMAFGSAADALRACRDAQRAIATKRWHRDVDLRVRMGLHSGAAEPGPEGYVAFAVHQAARIVSTAHGGQVVVSPVTVALVNGEAPGDCAFTDLGEYIVRDFEGPVRLYQLADSANPVGFPPLRTSPVGTSHLPRRRTTFVGRRAEIDQVKGLVAGGPLVTVVGTGGVGKTRLVLEAGDELAPFHPDGVWFADLTAVTDPESVPFALARAGGVEEEVDRQLMDTVVARLAEATALLIVDNCEHVIDAAADAIDALLAGCPKLHIVATSREALRVPGEQVVSLWPLQDESVQLFVDRALSLDPDLELDDHDRDVIGTVCRNLAGVPLAIELAAAQITTMSLADIHAGLDDLLHLLSGGYRTNHPRQRTLEGLLQWSYDLLDVDEQATLRWAAVFAGSFTADALTNVMHDARHVARSLSALVRKSLVQLRDTPLGTRYELLVTVAAFAEQRLRDADEWTQACTTHLAWCGGMPTDDLDRVDAEIENLLVAIQRAARAEAPAEAGAAPAATLLGLFAYRRSRMRSALPVLRELLAVDVLDTAGRASVLQWVGVLHDVLRETDAAKEALEEALVLARECGDRSLEAKTLNSLGNVAYSQGRLDGARALLEKSLELKRDLGGEGLASTLTSLGVVAVDQGRLPDAIGVIEESVAIDRAAGDRWGLGLNLLNLATARQRSGDVTNTATALVECFECLADEADADTLADALIVLGEVAQHEGELETAVVLAAAATELRAEMGLEDGRRRQALSGTAFVEDVFEGAVTLPDAPAEVAVLHGRGLDASGAIEFGLAHARRFAGT
jgi:predicted ATPase/class 3 adenylate cyclase